MLVKWEVNMLVKWVGGEHVSEMGGEHVSDMGGEHVSDMGRRIRSPGCRISLLCCPLISARHGSGKCWCAGYSRKHWLQSVGSVGVRDTPESTGYRVWDTPESTGYRVWDTPESTGYRVWDTPESTGYRVWDTPESTGYRVWEVLVCGIPQKALATECGKCWYAGYPRKHWLQKAFCGYTIENSCEGTAL